MTPSLSPLLLHQFTREYWSEYDAYALQNLLPAFYEQCYDPKIYKTPDITQEVIADQGYVADGLSITPGALLLGFIFPSTFETTEITLQITDIGLKIDERPHKMFPSGPVPWYMLSNGKVGFLNLLNTPHPIIEPGRLLVEFWNVSGEELRTQLILACLEPKRDRERL